MQAGGQGFDSLILHCGPDNGIGQFFDIFEVYKIMLRFYYGVSFKGVLAFMVKLSEGDAHNRRSKEESKEERMGDA